VWGRKLQDLDLKKVDALFRKTPKDVEGRISVKELTKLLKLAGFTLFSSAMDELLADMNATRDSTFDFSDYFRFFTGLSETSWLFAVRA